MNVVVCSAGKASRYKTPILTKGLVQLNGENILQRQIRLLKKNGLTDITVLVPPHFPTENYNVKFKVYDVPDDTEETWTLNQCLDVINETFVLLGDVVFTENTLKEILNAKFENVLFIVGERYVSRWKRENANEKLKPVEYKYDESYGFLTKNNGDKTIKKIISNMKVYSRRHGLSWIRNRYSLKQFYPNGFIMDLDKVEQLKKIKQTLKEEYK